MTSVQIDSLHIFPVKGCGGARLDEALVIETGLELDRAWMVVDRNGEFVSQRELPRMALVVPTVKFHEVVLRAPGMLALHLPTESAGDPVRVRVWDDECAAFDMGSDAAQWFSDFLGIKGLRLVRFDPEHERLSSFTWTGGEKAPNQFSDGYPILIASTASLDDLNKRLVRAGHAAVPMNRFRPNIVLSGLDAFGEDYFDHVQFGDLKLRLVKPCTRCNVPNIDQLTADSSPAVGDILTTFRADPRVQGALTFGMNAIVSAGVESELRVGMVGEAEVRF
jgi:uncharacterized protein